MNSQPFSFFNRKNIGSNIPLYLLSLYVLFGNIYYLAAGDYWKYYIIGFSIVFYVMAAYMIIYGAYFKNLGKWSKAGWSIGTLSCLLSASLLLYSYSRQTAISEMMNLMERISLL